MHIISGAFKGRTIRAPSGTRTRPTSGKLREALFNICRDKIEGAVFLDLFAGSGAVGLEALSRGAASATFIDNCRECARVIRENIEVLEAKKEAQVLFGDVFQQLDRMAKKKLSYDIIFADPPYDLIVVNGNEKIPSNAALLRLIDENKLLKPGGWLFLEDSARALSSDIACNTLEWVDKRAFGRSCLVHYRSRSV